MLFNASPINPLSSASQLLNAALKRLHSLAVLRIHYKRFDWPFIPIIDPDFNFPLLRVLGLKWTGVGISFLQRMSKLHYLELWVPPMIFRGAAPTFSSFPLLDAYFGPGTLVPYIIPGSAARTVAVECAYWPLAPWLTMISSLGEATGPIEHFACNLPRVFPPDAIFSIANCLPNLRSLCLIQLSSDPQVCKLLFQNLLSELTFTRIPTSFSNSKGSFQNFFMQCNVSANWNCMPDPETRLGGLIAMTMRVILDQIALLLNTLAYVSKLRSVTPICCISTFLDSWLRFQARRG
jgi:hypothetical protein